MKFSLDKKESFTIFSVLEKQLNTLNAPELKSELVLLNTEGRRNIILDMTEVHFVDSSGLSAILVGNRMCQAIDGVLILSNVQDHVNRLLKISQLDTVLTVTSDVQEARDLIMRHELRRELLGSTDVEEEG